MGVLTFAVCDMCVLQPNIIDSLLPSTNGMGDLSQPREMASDDSNLLPVGKKMSAPGIMQPYQQVIQHDTFTRTLFYSCLLNPCRESILLMSFSSAASTIQESQLLHAPANLHTSATGI